MNYLQNLLRERDEARRKLETYRELCSRYEAERDKARADLERGAEGAFVAHMEGMNQLRDLEITSSRLRADYEMACCAYNKVKEENERLKKQLTETTIQYNQELADEIELLRKACDALAEAAQRSA